MVTVASGVAAGAAGSAGPGAVALAGELSGADGLAGSATGGLVAAAVSFAGSLGASGSAGFAVAGPVESASSTVGSGQPGGHRVLPNLAGRQTSLLRVADILLQFFGNAALSSCAAAGVERALQIKVNTMKTNLNIPLPLPLNLIKSTFGTNPSRIRYCDSRFAFTAIPPCLATSSDTPGQFLVNFSHYLTFHLPWRGAQTFTATATARAGRRKRRSLRLRK